MILLKNFIIACVLLSSHLDVVQLPSLLEDRVKYNEIFTQEKVLIQFRQYLMENHLLLMGFPLSSWLVICPNVMLGLNDILASTIPDLWKFACLIVALPSIGNAMSFHIWDIESNHS